MKKLITPLNIIIVLLVLILLQLSGVEVFLFAATAIYPLLCLSIPLAVGYWFGRRSKR